MQTINQMKSAQQIKSYFDGQFICSKHGFKMEVEALESKLYDLKGSCNMWMYFPQNLLNSIIVQLTKIRRKMIENYNQLKQKEILFYYKDHNDLLIKLKSLLHLEEAFHKILNLIKKQMLHHIYRFVLSILYYQKLSNIMFILIHIFAKFIFYLCSY
ncbi:hypothetical protein C2G38_551012 [Gigaspora rosea]|uniref:Uncharacterized protein n=1 Tax=Gigaspora rosea TaxID=44941 RepID=A0A397VSZ7_9GLOM|nr:hypothetical protein C2G38_551012 [Gigaspora rosea]